MIIRNVIESELCTLFNQITSQLWIKANPAPTGSSDTPRPQGLYGTVHILNMTDTGATDYVLRENETGPGTDLTETVSGLRNIQISINTFRQGAFDLMSQLYTALQRNSTVEYLTARGLGYGNRSDIRDLSTNVSPGLEERYQMDLFIFSEATDEEIVFAIESINVVGNVENGTDQISVDIEVNNT